MPASPEIQLYRGGPQTDANDFRLTLGTGEQRTLVFRVRDYGEDDPADIRNYDTVELRSQRLLSTALRAPISVAKDETPWATGSLSIPVSSADLTEAAGTFRVSLFGLAAGVAQQIGRGTIEVVASPANAP